MNNFSKLGFIMATLGSSIGLGHIWRFPYMAGSNGGGAFVLLFLTITLVVGVSMLVAEMIIGNKGRANTQDSFNALDTTKAKKWKWGGIFLIGGPLVLTFYCVVLGWVIYYLVMLSFNLPSDVKTSQDIFVNLLNEGVMAQIICFFAIVFITGYFVARGVKAGIEVLNFILMPLLFIIFIGLLIYSMTLPSFSQGVHFMFDFDFSKITSKVLIDALGQVFFSLSIGAGTIITYAATTEEKQNLFSSAMWVVIPGILISLIAGVMIFTFVFEHNAEPASGPGLIFITLPLIFKEMGLTGNIICLLFMIGLAFAGISSTVSLLEPSVKWLEEKTKLNRFSATWFLSFLIFVVGVALIFSLNPNNKLEIMGKNLFDCADWLSANILLTLGGLTSCIFVGWVIGKEKLRSFTQHYFNNAAFELWLFSLRYLAPATILTILIYNLFIKG
ncbi:sodium-and chloride-dependent transporter [Helicobacter anseris]|uniref:Transporter n=1 Tax=Helicobacter anseris TaxID=375926 RepID=A0A3D8J9E5_9HELI|nr:sodium-dependent transporter [Helicobacter anseris]RDU74137.1 sodium-and chloride-dependent transporter [Helicobacter anseris]